MKVAAVRTFSLIALIVAVSPLSACGGGRSPSELAQEQRVAAKAQPHKDAIQQQEIAKTLKDQARARAAVVRAKKLKTARSAAANAAKAAPLRKAPQYGYQCMPGDEKRYNVCAGHKAWIDGQVVFDKCINAGRTWDVAAQQCGAMNPDAGPEGDGYGNP